MEYFIKFLSLLQPIFELLNGEEKVDTQAFLDLAKATDKQEEAFEILKKEREENLRINQLFKGSFLTLGIIALALYSYAKLSEIRNNLTGVGAKIEKQETIDR